VQQFADVLLGILHLPKYHAVVLATGTHELLVRPALDDAAVLHQQDEVGAPNR
jgi:hypothetical protein